MSLRNLLRGGRGLAALVAGAVLAGACAMPSEPASGPVGAGGPRSASPAAASGTADPSPAGTSPIADPYAVVAFWDARVANGDGYLDTLHLVDALLAATEAKGDFDALVRARTVLEAVADRVPPGDPGLPLRRGLVAHAHHEFDEAIAQAERVLEIDPGHDAALALVGDASLELGDVATAEEAYVALVDEDRSAPALARLARLRWLTGDAEEAEQLMREALTLAAPGSTFHHLQLAELLRSTNALDDAAALYDDVLAMVPDDVVATVGRALVDDAGGRRPNAIARLEHALQRGPDPDLLVALGDLYAVDGDLDAAEAAWDVAEELERTEFERYGLHARHLITFLADHDRSPDEAVALAEAEVRRGDVHGWDTLAWALYRAGRLDEAREASEQALRLGTPEAALHYHAGFIAEAQGRDADAVRLLLAAAEGDAGLLPLQRAALADALARLDAPTE